jgi:hypothetical protein
VAEPRLDGLKPRRSDRCYASISSLRLTANSRLISCLYESYTTKCWLRQPSIAAIMTVVAMPRRRQEFDVGAEYRQRMLVNALAASFITLMMIGGYWVVTTLVQVS